MHNLHILLVPGASHLEFRVLKNVYDNWGYIHWSLFEDPIAGSSSGPVALF